MDRCPDNSTECLLRVLIAQSNNGSPWDSRSFGFTVAIGVLAFFVSWVTVFQGLLAAGPGRMKSSSNAIGKFGKLSTGRVSWLEFAWRSTAIVPIITYDGLIQAVDGLPKLTVSEYGKNYPLKGNGVNTGASWLQLLRCVGLEDDFEITFKDSLKQYATDYLPADIQAPPAAIQQRCLAILAGIADPSMKYEKTDGGVRIIGEISQVSFRAHPVLGLLAAYERHQTTYEGGKLQSELDLKKIHKQSLEQFLKEVVPSLQLYASLGRCTKLALEHAAGNIKLRWTHPASSRSNEWLNLIAPNWQSSGLTVYDFTTIMPTGLPYSERCESSKDSGGVWGAALALVVAQSDYEVRPFPWELMNLCKAVQLLAACGPELHPSIVMLDDIKKCLHALHFGQSRENIDLENILPDLYGEILFEEYGSWIVPQQRYPLLISAFSNMASKVIDGAGNMILRTELGRSRTSRLVDHANLDFAEYVSSYQYLLKYVDAFLAHNKDQAMKALTALKDHLCEYETTHMEEHRLQAMAQNSMTRSSENAICDPDQANTQLDDMPSTNPTHLEEATNITPRTTPLLSPQDQEILQHLAQFKKLHLFNGQPCNLETCTCPDAELDQTIMVQNFERAYANAQVLSGIKLPEDVEGMKQRGFELLLIIRGILFAAVLEAGPDTSKLWAKDFVNPIVNMI